MSEADPNARRPLHRQPLLAMFLVLGVLSSLGHGAGGGSAPGVPVEPQEPAVCADNTLTLEVVGDGQSGIAGVPLPNTLRLLPSCLSKRDGSRMEAKNIAVTWEVSSGGGAVDGQPRIEQNSPDASAYAVNWQLGEVVGTQSLTVRAQGLSKLIMATGTTPKPGGSCKDFLAGTGTNFGSHDIRGNERWPLAGSPYRIEKLNVLGGQLQIDAGVQVCATDITVFNSARLTLQGRADAPVRLDPQEGSSSGLSIAFYNNTNVASASPSELLHARVQGLAFLFADSHALRIEDSSFSNDGMARGLPNCSTVRLRSAVEAVGPTTIRRSTFDGFGRSAGECMRAGVLLEDTVARSATSVFAARVLRAPGVGVEVIAAGTGTSHWSLENCELTRNGGDGLAISSPMRQVSNCAFSQNGGLGLRSGSPTTFAVDARSNWWGDAAGPGGPSGDGVSAGVDFTPFLTAPPNLGY